MYSSAYLHRNVTALQQLQEYALMTARLCFQDSSLIHSLYLNTAENEIKMWNVYKFNHCPIRNSQTWRTDICKLHLLLQRRLRELKCCQKSKDINKMYKRFNGNKTPGLRQVKPKTGFNNKSPRNYRRHKHSRTEGN